MKHLCITIILATSLLISSFTKVSAAPSVANDYKNSAQPSQQDSHSKSKLPPILGYYKNSNPSQLSELFKFFDKNSLISNQKYIWYTAVFLHLLSKKYPEQKSHLEKLALEHSKELERIFTYSANHSLNEILQPLQKDPHVLLNDMYWVCFHVTGDTKYLEHLLSHLKYIKDPSQSARYFVGQTAKWSFTANFPHDASIKQFVEKAASQETGELKSILTDILNKSPQEIRYQTTIELKAALEKYPKPDVSVPPFFKAAPQ